MTTPNEASDWLPGTYLGISMTLAQAAEVLGLSPSTLRWQIRNGKLSAQKMGSVWIVERSEIARYRNESQR